MIIQLVTWLLAAAIGIPTLVVASYPIHAWWVLRRRIPLADRSSGFVSILVPVQGLDEGRIRALRRLTAQRTGSDIEWIFCVENESDPALEELYRVAAGRPDRIRVLLTGPSGKRLGKMHNLMAGAAAARGAWLVLVDSDAILPHAGYIREFTASLRTADVGLVTCFPAYRGAGSIPGAMLAGAINHDLLGHFALQSVWGGLRLANGPCMAIRREVLDRIGGFDPQSTCLLMDVILAHRVRQAGYRVVMHHEPVEISCRTVTLKMWWNQAHRWQVGMAHVLSGPFYIWYVWMRSAFPVALLMAFFANGPLAVFGAAAVVTRMSIMVIVSQVFLRDRQQLAYLWLLPFIDIVTAIGCWYALVEDQVEWRGRRYRVLSGGVTQRLS